jgi:polyhydroxyalkanoate synthesis regulator phasin
MTSNRSQAYGRVMHTLADLGPAKLLDDEVERLRDVADTLLFTEDMADEAASAAVRDARSVIDHLVSSGRWTEERAGRLSDDLAACGPLARVA